MTVTEDILVQLNQTQPAYTVQEQGEYMVVPVVMMTPGVRHGSAGPVLHLEEYYSQNPEDWNGQPVTAGHPKNSDGEYVLSTNADPDQWVVGHLRNTRVEDGKLKADVYIHEQRAIAINPEIVNYIREGKPLDVSIGAITHDQPENGTYEDQEYQSVTVVYNPDHLALLPGDRGACSWADGCGIRNNKDESKTGTNMSDIQVLKDDAKKGIGVTNGLQDNEAGFMEISSRIQSMLDRRDSEALIHFLKEIYDDYFVYEVRNRDQGTQRFFRQEYTFNEDENDVNFDGERIEVRKNVEFVPLQNNEEEEGCGCGGDSNLTRTKFNNNQKEDTMSDEKKQNNQPSGEVQEKVVGLINNERTRFTKSDRSWLLQLNSDQLETLEPTEAPEQEVTREQALQALEADLSDVEKLKEIVSDDVRGKVEQGLQAYEDTREKLIKTIQSNTSKEDWPEEDLKGMETSMLQKLAKTVQAVDYSGQGPVHNNSSHSGDEEEVLLPAGVQAE